MIYDDFAMARATIINRLKTEFETNPIVPFNEETVYKRKPSKRPMRQVAIAQNPILIMPDMEYFEIGNQEAESKNPYYHILEDAQKIRKPYMGTKKTKGTQANKLKYKRDYGKFTYFKDYKGALAIGQEYRTNFQKRDYRQISSDLTMKSIRFNEKARTFRYNKHWAWIERLLEQVVPKLATELNAKVRVSQGADFYEEPELILVNSDGSANYDVFSEISNTSEDVELGDKYSARLPISTFITGEE